MLLVIDNYDSFTFNLVQYLGELKSDYSIARTIKVERNDALSILQIKALKPDGIILSPGPGNPNQAGNCLKIVRDLHKKIPILGVCLGHQIIGQVFGSKITKAKKIMHGKTSSIISNKIGILKNVPKKFEATRYHSLIVDKKSISKDLVITAETNDGVIMGLMHKKYNIHGVQFHPESIKTPVGLKILKNFINYY